jgi:twinkle protein
VYKRPTYHETGVADKAVQWFASRGIPEQILVKHRISYGMAYMGQDGHEVPTIQFPYYRNGDVINIKYRDGHKHFRQEGGAERIFYGLDDIEGDELIIVEGEIDKLSLEVAGYTSVVSVPDGAPAVGTESYETKFEFLTSAESVLRPMKRIIIAVDTDGPGETLAEELARRLGHERCYRVRWSGGCKDANEVLVSHGAKVVAECVDAAQPWPVSGIITIEMIWQSVEHMYDYGLPRGVSPGWTNLARYYTVRPGELTIITGIPSHGKTFFLSAMMVELARLHQWQLALFSPENYPIKRYTAQLLEQYLGLPFDGYPDRMSKQEMREGLQWLSEHFTFLMPEQKSPTVEHLLELAKVQVYRQGIKGLMLDPWNQIDHPKAKGDTETEYISQALGAIRDFARRHEVHVWVIAHPTKLRKAEKGTYSGQYPPPTPYDISGSSHFRNKADNCLTVWRNIENGNRTVEIHVQKIRFREIGNTGQVELEFLPKCGRFIETEIEETHTWVA